MVFETTLEALKGVAPARRDQLLCAALASGVNRSRRLLALDDPSPAHEVSSAGRRHVVERG